MPGRKAAMAKKDSATARPPRMKIKKGDHVVVTAGKDRGREGTVILADPERQRVMRDLPARRGQVQTVAGR